MGAGGDVNLGLKELYVLEVTDSKDTKIVKEICDKCEYI